MNEYRQVVSGEITGVCLSVCVCFAKDNRQLAVVAEVPERQLLQQGMMKKLRLVCKICM